MSFSQRAFFLLLLLFAVYLYGIHYLFFRGEEANRILTAYEMIYFHDFFSPTHLGEPYYNKPPLFMWLIAFWSSIFGWKQEIIRTVSVISTFLTALLVFFFSKELLFREDTKNALLAVLIFLTLGDLLFFYGFIAEIDAFLMFLNTLEIFVIYLLLKKEKDFWAFTVSGIFTALFFLTKGLPAFYHIPVSFLILLFYFGRVKKIFSANLLGSLLGLLAPLTVWYINLKHPLPYLQTLWNESFNRTAIAQKGGFFKHLLLYPLLNLKQTLPHSMVAPISLFKGRLPALREILLLLALIGFNYLPYWLSPGARGRYILLVFPFLAIVFALLLSKLTFLLKRNTFTYTLLGTSLISFLLSVFLFFKHFEFFDFYGLYPFLVISLILFLFSVFYWKRFDNFGALILLLATLKVGYINYIAPLKDKSHPERRIAIEFSKFINRSPQIEPIITYLPKGIDMELCAYLDIYSKGVVLRKEGSFFVTREGQMPKRPYEVLKSSHGWVLGVFK